MPYLTQGKPEGGRTTQIREIRVSYRGSRRKLPHTLNGPDQVAAFMRKLVGTEAREHFVVIHLDGRHRPIGFQVASIGTATASLIHPREVFQPAIAVGAVALIVCHNHPSGDPKPSAEDYGITKRLIEAGNVLGIQLLDHVVCGSNSFNSMREQNSDLFGGS